MRAIDGVPILELLGARGEAQQRLFARAREVRSRIFGSTVALRGAIEVSSHCCRSCDYCAMRSSNRELVRYRMTADEIAAAASAVKARGIPTVLIQSGQDPSMDGVVEEAVRLVRREGLRVLLCLGERTREQFAGFRSAGADGYILKFESSDPALYARVTHGDHGARLKGAAWLRELDFRVGIGNIVGLPGQSPEILEKDLLHASAFRPDFVSAAPFIPNENTPFECEEPGDLDLTLNVLALLRLLLPEALIPSVSALAKLDPAGQLLGLNAGANVMTVNFTPEAYRSGYLIYSRERFIVSLEHAFASIEAAGLAPSGA